MKLAAGLILAAAAAVAQPSYVDLLNQIPYRNLGPFRAGAWTIGVGVPANPAVAHAHTFYAAVRTGGVWKTTNNGVTFENVSDSAGLNSIGAIAVAPSDANVVWVGSGDNSITRSAYYGNGIYKSTDAGKSWANMGLADTQHFSRIAIDPANPNVVYAAALGHLFSPNAERGVFKTTDGGRTWTKSLFRNDHTGAVDLVMDPRDSTVLYAAMYDGMRHPWHLDDGGPESGIYKTTDGGATWNKLTAGLPAGTVGRIGIDICRTHPDTLYAVVDNFNTMTRPAGRGGRGGGVGAIGGEVYRTDDAGKSWRRTSAEGEDVSRKAGYSFNQITVDPNDAERAYITGSNMIGSKDGGKTWEGLGQYGRGDLIFRGTFGDFRSLWIDPQDSLHMIATSDGGVSVSYDGGRTADHMFNIKAGEVYAIGVDNAQPYNLYAGLQDHENWKGPVNGAQGRVGIEDWVTTGIGDGMYNVPDPNGRWLYNTQEFGKMARVDMEQHTRTVIAPPKPEGMAFLRYNWTAPVAISPHDSNIVYAGAQVLFRSKDRGDHWEVISPDLTANDPAKITPPPNTSIQYCTLTTMAESPAQAGVIWTGADDGTVEVTRDGGAHWTNVTAKIAAAGGPADAWVTRVMPSHSAAGVAYVAKSRRRFDDYRAYVYRTTDFGATWVDISKGLTAGVNALVEDPAKPSLVFAGTDTGVAVSFDAGKSWTPFRSNMPVVPVHDLAIQARDIDLVAGTYGRGLWVAHVAPLRSMSGDFATADAALFEIAPYATRGSGAWGNYHLYGDRYPVTPNEPNGMAIAYYVKRDGPATLVIADASGKEVRKIEGQAKAGINRTLWNLNNGQGAEAPAGEYAVTLSVGGHEYKQAARLISRAPEDYPRGGRGGD